MILTSFLAVCRDILCTTKNLYLQTAKLQDNSGSLTLHVQPCIKGQASRGMRWTHVTEAQWMAPIVGMHCDSRAGGWPEVLAVLVWHLGARAHTHARQLASRAQELRHFKGFNLCTKKMAGGGKLEGEHRRFFRRRGSTSEGPLISHKQAKLYHQRKWHHLALHGDIASRRVARFQRPKGDRDHFSKLLSTHCSAGFMPTTGSCCSSHFVTFDWKLWNLMLTSTKISSLTKHF